MRLSGCVLVKDEQKTLARCLEGLRGIVDELIVVDTGSTDRSMDIARQMGAEVRHFAWIDDFASARNYALSLLTGDWVFFLDADEYISISGTWLRDRLRKEQNDSLLCSLVNLAHDDITVYNTTQAIRVFRLSPDIRYTRRIHEYLVNGSRPISCTDCSSDMTVYHLGYSPEVVHAKDKFQRNRLLLLRELREDRYSSDLHYYLGETYLLRDDFKKAMRRFQRAMALRKFVHVMPYWAWARHVLLMIKSGEYDHETMLEAVDTGLRNHPESPELWAYRGMILYTTPHASESLFCLERSVLYSRAGNRVHYLYEDIHHEVLELIVKIKTEAGVL